MKEEAEQYNDPGSFVKYAKMQRKITKLQIELDSSNWEIIFREKEFIRGPASSWSWKGL